MEFYIAPFEIKDVWGKGTSLVLLLFLGHTWHVQGLLLPLHSGITHGRVLGSGPYGGPEIQHGMAMCQANKHLPTLAQEKEPFE